MMVVTSCGLEVKNDNSIKIEKSELYGSWVQISDIKNSEQSDGVAIKKINFKKDLTADVEILDSFGYKTITGEWADKEKKAGPVSIESGIVLTFWTDSLNLQALALSTEEINNKKCLNSGTAIFEKQ